MDDAGNQRAPQHKTTTYTRRKTPSPTSTADKSARIRRKYGIEPYPQRAALARAASQALGGLRWYHRRARPRDHSLSATSTYAERSKVNGHPLQQSRIPFPCVVTDRQFLRGLFFSGVARESADPSSTGGGPSPSSAGPYSEEVFRTWAHGRGRPRPLRWTPDCRASSPHQRYAKVFMSCSQESQCSTPTCKFFFRRQRNGRFAAFFLMPQKMPSAGGRVIIIVEKRKLCEISY